MPGRDSEFWKYTAVFLASMLFLSNAAHYYSRQVMKVELASYQDDSKAPIRDSDVRESSGAADHPITDYGTVEVTGLRPDEKCIQGQRFGKVNGLWEVIGSC